MRTLLFAGLLGLVAACGNHERDACGEVLGGPHHARNPATGVCWQFDSACDVPEGWEACETECQADILCLIGSVQYDCECVEGCYSTGDCPEGQECVMPRYDAIPLGSCQVVTPPEIECTSDSDCGGFDDLLICPAAYPAWCVEQSCPSTCQRICWWNDQCAAGEHCNASEVCYGGKRDRLRTSIACTGWCVPD